MSNPNSQECSYYTQQQMQSLYPGTAQQYFNQEPSQLNSTLSITSSTSVKPKKSDQFGFKLTMQSLINQSAKILSEIEQTKSCIDSWYKKHISQLSDIDKKLREMLIELDAKTKVISQQEFKNEMLMQSNNYNSAQEMAMKLKRGAIEIFKENMQSQLDNFQLYLDYLFKSIKSLPDNQPIIMHVDIQKKKELASYFRVVPVTENRQMPKYDKLLAQIDNDYLVLVNFKNNFTDVVFASTQGFRNVQRYPRSYSVVHQHEDRLILGNDVYSISAGFRQMQSFGNEEVLSLCSYDPNILLVGYTNYKIGIYNYNRIRGEYSEFSQLRIMPQHAYSEVVGIIRLSPTTILVAVGKSKVAIRVIDFDPIKWVQTNFKKVGTYSSKIVDLHRVSDFRFLAMTLKKIISFDCRQEGFDKILRFKDINSSMILFPFYDHFDLPYIIGDQNKIYDMKSKMCVGSFEGMEADMSSLGFMEGTSLLIASGISHGLQLLNLEMIQL